jgi:ribonuclease VapC
VIVNSSAVVAIIKNEPEADALRECLENSHLRPKISAANWYEASIVIDGTRDDRLIDAFEAQIARMKLEIIPFSEKHALIARRAYQRFGKGSKHPAQLNFGDCFAYALASESGEPLLFKGNDFAQTDVEAAL